MDPVDGEEISAEMRAEAATWLARLRADDVTAADQAGFQVWLAEDLRHAQAFEHMTNVWDMAGGLGLTPAHMSALSPTVNRRALVMGGSAALAATAVGGVYWLTAATAYATEVGEQRRIALADGSTIMLDTDTRIRARLTDSRRHIQLVKGRAHFQVATDPLRPFVVRAGDRQVVALGTAFDVSDLRNELAVVLVEGRVSIRPAEDVRQATQTLSPGERVVYRDSRVVMQDRPNLTKVTAWQSGRAVFDDETLGEAVAEMNRYSRRPLIVADAALGDLRISGVYDASDIEGFARSVSTLLPASAEIKPDLITLSLKQKY